MQRAAIVLAVFLSLTLVPVPGQSQVEEKDLGTYLPGVTERGRDLYGYDQAAWHGSDALMVLFPDTKGLTRPICHKTAAGWVVSVAKWNDAHDQLLVLADAAKSEKTGKFVARKIDPPKKASDELTAMGRAQELAIKNFSGEKRPYNVAVLPAPAGKLYVYVYPGQMKEFVFPLGGDVRYLISADGKLILEKRQLHKNILDMEFRPDDRRPAGMHMHRLSDVPEDTDVLYVLSRKPAIPESIIISPHRMFIVDPDGSIEYRDPCAGNNDPDSPCNLKPATPEADDKKTQH